MATSRGITYLGPTLLKLIAAGDVGRVISTLDAEPSLLNAKIKPSTEKDSLLWTPLEWAIHNNKPEIVRTLLRKKADPGKSILVAIDKVNWECVDVFAEELEDMDDQYGFGEALLKASAENRLATVRKLVAAKATVTCVDPNNKKGVLHFAGQHSNGEMISCLVRAGAKLDQEYEDSFNGKLVPARLAMLKQNKTNDDWLAYEKFAEEAKESEGKYGFGVVVLYAAMEHTPQKSRVGTVRKFIEAGAIINWNFVNIHDNNTALHFAAKKGCLDMVRDLLEAGADPTTTNSLGRTALDYALDGQCTEIVDLFLNHEKIRHQKEQEKLMQAEAARKEKEAEEKQAQDEARALAQKKQEEAQALEEQKQVESQALEEKRSEEKTLSESSKKTEQQANSTHDTQLGITLLNAIRVNQVTVVHKITEKFPLDEEITIDGAKHTALSWAIEQNKPDVVWLLLEKGANPHKYIIDAANHQYWFCVDAFTKEKKDPNNKHGFGSALLRVVYNYVGEDKLAKVKVLIGAKASLDATFDDGCGVLHCAALRGDIDVILELLKAGANPKLRNKAGETALDCALKKDRWDVVEAFVKNESAKKELLEISVKEEPVNLPTATRHFLEGTVNLSELRFLEEHYKKTGNTGRAMLIAFFLDFYLGESDSSHLNFLKQLRGCVGELYAIQQFYLACLNRKKDGLRFVDHIQNEYGYISPGELFVLALQKEYCASTNDKISELSPAILGFVSKRFRQSLEYMSYEQGKFVASDFDARISRLRETAALLRKNARPQSTYLGNVLFHAISSDRVAIVDEILKQKFPLAVRIDFEGRKVTALEWAVLQNKPEMVRRLLKADANPSSALGLAARSNHWDCVDVFIEEKRLGKEIPNEDGALHCAVRKQDSKRVEALLKAGANPNATNKAGETPFSIAQKNQDWELINAFLTNQQKPAPAGMEQKQEEKSELVARKFPSLKVAFDQAELASVSGIGFMASHYMAPKSRFVKQTFGRALLYCTLMALALGPKHPEYSKYYDYVRFFSSKKNKYMLLKTFCINCLNQSFIAELQRVGFELNLQLMVFVLDNEIEKAPFRTNHTSLAVSELNEVKKVIDESVSSICKDTGTADTYLLGMRGKTESCLRKISPSALPSDLIANKFLASEKAMPENVENPQYQPQPPVKFEDVEFDFSGVENKMEGPRAWVEAENSSIDIYPCLLPRDAAYSEQQQQPVQEAVPVLNVPNLRLLPTATVLRTASAAPAYSPLPPVSEAQPVPTIAESGLSTSAAPPPYASPRASSYRPYTDSNPATLYQPVRIEPAPAPSCPAMRTAHAPSRPKFTEKNAEEWLNTYCVAPPVANTGHEAQPVEQDAPVVSQGKTSSLTFA